MYGVAHWHRPSFLPFPHQPIAGAVEAVDVLDLSVGAAATVLEAHSDSASPDLDGIVQSMKATSRWRPSLKRPARTQASSLPHIAPPIRRSVIARTGRWEVSTSAIRQEAPRKPHQSPPLIKVDDKPRRCAPRPADNATVDGVDDRLGNGARGHGAAERERSKQCSSQPRA